jgi:hypothetical protein
MVHDEDDTGSFRRPAQAPEPEAEAVLQR